MTNQEWFENIKTLFNAMSNGKCSVGILNTEVTDFIARDFTHLTLPKNITNWHRELNRVRTPQQDRKRSARVAKR